VNTQIKKIIIVALIAVLVVIFDCTYIHVFVNHRHTNGNRVIIIDPGHGGIDGGAVGKSGTIEKNINLDISKKLKAYIESGGDTCIMIREVDEGLYGEYGSIRNKKNEDLKNRKDIIKQFKADIFISVHLNSFPQSQYYGAQVFYPENNEESKLLARKVQEELISILNRGNKRVEKESNSYYLLKDNPVPSILIECGFLSNPEEERLLNDSEYQNKIAWAAYKGIIRYFTEPK
jgi:N-acetylmuramoyl-L-alanine amidase